MSNRAKSVTHTARRRCRWAWALLLLLGAGLPATADVIHPGGVPALSSRPGAAYTIYLDFDGFSFTGTWGVSGKSPGDTAAYLDRTTDFTATDAGNIQQIWARVAEKYSGWDINVTTVDPAALAGQANTDALRQAYYDSTPKLMHTVVGGNGAWSGGGGVSYVDVTPDSFAPTANNGAGAGWHTDFVFAAENPADLQFVGEAAAHENGHGLGLNHQGDHFGSTNNEYSTNNGAQGNGSYAPVMGASYTSQRGAWRIGTLTGGGTQNDVQVIAANPGLGAFVDDAVGHARSTATPLPLLGDGSVDYNTAKGAIVPASGAAAQPIGADNYRSDFFVFHASGGAITLTSNDGSEFIAPGSADPGATLRSSLSILDASGNLFAIAPEAASTLSETFTGALPAGTYYAEISSYGGYPSTYDPSALYYDMGSYFLTGSGFSAVGVPEPALAAAVGLAVPFLLRRRRGSAPLGRPESIGHPIKI